MHTRQAYPLTIGENSTGSADAHAKAVSHAASSAPLAAIRAANRIREARINATGKQLGCTGTHGHSQLLPRAGEGQTESAYTCFACAVGTVLQANGIYNQSPKTGKGRSSLNTVS